MFEMLSLMSEASDESGKQPRSSRAHVFLRCCELDTDTGVHSFSAGVGTSRVAGAEGQRGGEDGVSSRTGGVQGKHSNRTYEAREGLWSALSSLAAVRDLRCGWCH